MNFLHTFVRLLTTRDRVHPFEHIEGCNMKGIDADIQFLKKLFEDYMDILDAEEQNRLVNLIQKLVLIRDMKGMK